ncbi:MAG TPA: type II secretion system F family protein [Microthrixaceae bacterium]|nr:type II secretion system F family protein [Microthrixaceae bacterium]
MKQTAAEMTSLLLAMCAAVGLHLLLTSSRSAARDSARPSRRAAAGERVVGMLTKVGLDGVSPVQFIGASLAVGLTVMVPVAIIFGPGPSTLIVAGCAATVPSVLWRRRRLNTIRVARESWPRLIDELRVLTGSAGRPIPQALIEVGLNGPEELRPAFIAAQREWALTTNFDRMIAVLKRTLADPAADATFETLLVAVQVGGDLDSRLAALAEDRRQDLLGRKDAQAKQSGAKFARIFVIIVPSGMALAGLSVGEGAASYRTGMGQTLVSVGIGLVILCWIWASRIMRLPEANRVFET